MSCHVPSQNDLQWKKAHTRLLQSDCDTALTPLLIYGFLINFELCRRKKSAHNCFGKKVDAHQECRLDHESRRINWIQIARLIHRAKAA